MIVNSTVQVRIEPVIDIDRFSKYSRFLRVTARILTLKGTNQSLSSIGKELTPNDISSAEEYWIKEAQSIYSDKDISNRFQRLGAKRRDDGIIIVGARIESWMKNCYKEDIILLPYQHKLSKLVLIRE